jgi:hypothetical protein
VCAWKTDSSTCFATAASADDDSAAIPTADAEEGEATTLAGDDFSNRADYDDELRSR